MDQVAICYHTIKSLRRYYIQLVGTVTFYILWATQDITESKEITCQNNGFNLAGQLSLGS
jgi:hypothetical protein